MELEDYRAQIDEIDGELTKLIVRRMQTVAGVAEYKKTHGLPVLQPSREESVISRAEANCPEELRESVGSIFRYIMELSRMRQRALISPCGLTLERFMLDARTPVQNPTVAVQGVAGSFASLAADEMYPGARAEFCDSWEHVFAAVADGSADYGILPVENSLAGSVNEVYDLLIKYGFCIVKAIPLAVDQYLLGVRGAKLPQIKNVYSQQMALRQCGAFISGHPQMKKHACPNTAEAAEFVARTGSNLNAAIASRECARIYGLDILAGPIQSGDDNSTRFVSVSRLPEFPEGANKISLVFTLPHVTGSLYRTLMRFALDGLNLTKIESRPCSSQNNFEYYFYLDFVGSLRSRRTLELLSCLSEELPSFRFLGNYCEAQ